MLDLMKSNRILRVKLDGTRHSFVFILKVRVYLFNTMIGARVRKLNPLLLSKYYNIVAIFIPVQL